MAVELADHLKLMRVGKLALMVPVIDVHRRPLGGHDHMNAGRARHLRQALHRGLDLLAGDHHQVGHLVDHHDDQGTAASPASAAVPRRSGDRCRDRKPVCTLPGHDLALGPRVGDTLVEAGDVADTEAGSWRGSGAPSRGRSISAPLPPWPARSPPAPSDAGCLRRWTAPASSDRSGSMRHWSGDRRYSSDRIMALTPTDLPDPVVPAIIRCGIRARSATCGLAADILAQRQRQTCRRAAATSSLARISAEDKYTVSRFAVRHLDPDHVAARARWRCARR